MEGTEEEGWEGQWDQQPQCAGGRASPLPVGSGSCPRADTEAQGALGRRAGEVEDCSAL